jgi:amino acid adenylation domain-containing protein
VEGQSGGGSSLASVGTVVELFEAQVARAPYAVALRFGDAALTYAELNMRANQLAHSLRGLGLGPEDVVGLFCERGIELIVGLLGILKSGAAYLPIDPDYPTERVTFLLTDANCRVVCSAATLQGRITPPVTPVVLATKSATGPTHDPDPVVGPDNLAYVIYTSGSTGRPKGVAVPHRGWVNLAKALVDEHELSSADTVIQYSSVCFDASVYELAMAWGAGATLRVLERGLVGDDLAAALEQEESAVSILVPSVLATIPATSSATFRRLVAGGEPFPPSLLARWASKATIFNAYGPTECTVASSIFRCDQAVDAERVPIGHPIADKHTYLLDANLEPVGAGVPGEIYIGGVGLARGYLDRPGLTAERFVPDPFGAPGARMYRTGDRARLLPDGDLDFLGRVDDQVKVRGFRIELQEIEAVVSAHADVRQATVVVREDNPGERRLVAYVVFRDAGDDSVTRLRDFVRGSLPNYMVPSAFVVLEQIPRTTSGKVDRKALPAPANIRRDMATAFVAPRNALESALSAIWGEVLGIDEVGVEDNFFELGGHSLLATQVVARAEAALGTEIPLRNLFESPTVAGMAAALTQSDAGAGRAARRLPATASGDVHVLSAAQQWIWLSEQMHPGSGLNPDFTLAQVWASEQRIDNGAFAHVVAQLIERHEALRTVIRESDGQPQQVVIPLAQIEIDATILPAAGESYLDDEALQAALRTEESRPIDPTAGRMLRATLIHHRAADHLVFAAHHSACDPDSLDIIVEDFEALYRAHMDPAQTTPPPPPLTYAAYAELEAQRCADKTSASGLHPDLSLVRRDFVGVRPLRLPTDFRLRTRVGPRRLKVARKLAHVTPADVDQLARHFRTTHFVVLSAVFATLLAEWSKLTQFAIGSVMSTRRSQETERLVGLFLEPAFLSAHVADPSRHEDVIESIRRSMVDWQSAALPFFTVLESVPDLANAIGPRGRWVFLQVFDRRSRSPLAAGRRRAGERMLRQVDREVPVVTEPDGDQGDLVEVAGPSELGAYVLLTDEGVFWDSFYSPELWARSTVEQIALRYDELLGRFLLSSL